MPIIIDYIFISLIYFMTSKTNGFSDVAYIAWIPLINFYNLSLLTANGDDDSAGRAAAKKTTLIFMGLFIVTFSLIPIICYLTFLITVGYVIYYSFRLLYRWSGDTGKAILYIILSIITGGLFFMIYGLIHMNRPFKA
ncbi:hypothetical protein ACQKII_18080 [Lysinibacillus sp. NPDC048646]|uniref:hypothetical protein n=1 Tax=Lysinibacillus sp. NPDC048646 TaxID=3390574 RepID=UPI003D033459